MSQEDVQQAPPGSGRAHKRQGRQNEGWGGYRGMCKCQCSTNTENLQGLQVGETYTSNLQASPLMFWGSKQRQL